MPALKTVINKVPFEFRPASNRANRGLTKEPLVPRALKPAVLDAGRVRLDRLAWVFGFSR
jgi:hypothetical protein